MAEKQVGAYASMLTEATSSGQAKSLTAKFIKWQVKGAKIIGKLLSVSMVKSSKNEGTYNHYIFETDDGRVKFYCGKVFDDEKGIFMMVGGVYCIEYLGSEKLTGGHTVNNYDLIEIEQPRTEHAAR
jgi:hypothetical protein